MGMSGADCLRRDFVWARFVLVLRRVEVFFRREVEDFFRVVVFFLVLVFRAAMFVSYLVY